MKGSFGVIGLLFLFALGGCKKPVIDVNDNVIPPLVLSTSIYDSLPQKTVQALNLGDITGLKFKYTTGLYANYFAYEADPQAVLNAISELPFQLSGSLADTLCHKITFNEIRALQQNISRTELERTSFFWNTDPVTMAMFECIKPPYRHTLLLTKNSDRILHRIEFIGHS